MLKQLTHRQSLRRRIVSSQEKGAMLTLESGVTTVPTRADHHGYRHARSDPSWRDESATHVRRGLWPLHHQSPYRPDHNLRRRIADGVPGVLRAVRHQIAAGPLIGSRLYGSTAPTTT